MPTRPISCASFRRMMQVSAIFAVALLAMAAMPADKQSAAILKERYLSPLEIASSPDGRFALRRLPRQR